LGAFSPPLVVTGEDVVQTRRLAQLVSREAAGLEPSGIWIVAGSFRPEARRAAEEQGVALSTWAAWRALNALPPPSPAQLQMEAPTVVDPSGRSFCLDLTGRSEAEEAAADAAQALAEKAGFAPSQRRDIHEAVRLGCRDALRRVAGANVAVRVRARLDEHSLTVAVEHEIPRWRAAPVDGAGAPGAEVAWDLAPLKSRVDQALAEGLPWGSRLTLRKRLDPFPHLGTAGEF